MIKTRGKIRLYILLIKIRGSLTNQEQLPTQNILIPLNTTYKFVSKILFNNLLCINTYIHYIQ